MVKRGPPGRPRWAWCQAFRNRVATQRASIFSSARLTPRTAPAALAVSVRINPRRHRGRAGLGLFGNDEAFPLRDLLGVQQLGQTDRFGFELPSRFTVGFLGCVLVEELASDRDRRFVAGRRLDALLADETIGKTLHRRRWWICCGAFTDCSTNQGNPSRGSAIRQLVMIREALSGPRKRTERRAAERGNASSSIRKGGCAE